jgi:fumarate reductase subunit C
LRGQSSVEQFANLSSKEFATALVVVVLINIVALSFVIFRPVTVSKATRFYENAKMIGAQDRDYAYRKFKDADYQAHYTVNSIVLLVVLVVDYSLIGGGFVAVRKCDDSRF